MKNCEECSEETCKIRGEFDEVFKAAGHEWLLFQSRRESLTTEAFWEEFEVFYNKYPTCIMEALEEVLMDMNMDKQRLRAGK